MPVSLDQHSEKCRCRQTFRRTMTFLYTTPQASSFKTHRVEIKASYPLSYPTLPSMAKASSNISRMTSG